MNLIEKMYALLVSDTIDIWQYQHKKEPPRFYYYRRDEPSNREGYGFDTLEAMIEAAYACIDPLRKPLPPECPQPPIVGDRATGG